MVVGVGLSVMASALFGLLYYYVTLLEPLEGNELFAWRVLLALPALALIIGRTNGWVEVMRLQRRFFNDAKFAALLILSAALIGVQTWLFVWAPVNQKGLDVSMGYFLLPLFMVVVGRIAYQERLSRMQAWAVALAAIGVAHELLLVSRFSWATAVVMLGYPPYFMLRRHLRMGSFTTLWFDMMLLVPIALLILLMQPHSVWQVFHDKPTLMVSLPVMGAISSIALVAYIAASRLLPLGLFGILSYVEPVLLFWVAFLLLKEPMSWQAWLTYIPIWMAVALVALEGLIAWRRGARR